MHLYSNRYCRPRRSAARRSIPPHSAGRSRLAPLERHRLATRDTGRRGGLFMRVRWRGISTPAPSSARIARWHAPPRRGQTRSRHWEAPTPGTRQTETATAARAAVASVALRRVIARLALGARRRPREPQHRATRPGFSYKSANAESRRYVFLGVSPRDGTPRRADVKRALGTGGARGGDGTNRNHDYLSRPSAAHPAPPVDPVASLPDRRKQDLGCGIAPTVPRAGRSSCRARLPRCVRCCAWLCADKIRIRGVWRRSSRLI